MSKRTDPEVYAHALASVAARQDPKEAAATCAQAAAALTQAMNKTANPDWLRALAQGLALVASHLDAKGAKEVAETLTQAISKRTDPIGLQGLLLALAAVAAPLEPKEAKEVAVTFTHAWSKTFHNGLGVLAQGLGTVFRGESTDRRLQRFRSVTGSIGLATDPAALPLTLAVLARSLEPPTEPLPSQDLVEVLKHPLCVGAARRAVLDALGTRYQRAFTDQWDFVRFATEQQLGLDLSSPPKRPELPARAAQPGGPPSP
jgi:hypothetical protein